RLAFARREGGPRSAGGAAPDAGGIRQGPAGVRAMARGSGLAHHGALDREPRLAALLRHGPGGDKRGPRHPGAATVASGAPRLARGGDDGARRGGARGWTVRADAMVPEASSPADRQQLHLPAVIAGDPGAA